ncbi:MAG: hypothetical protein ACRD6X_01725 [Pyrinomonadaceae bacterium]
MKLTRSFLAIALNFSLVIPAILFSQTQTLFAQSVNGAVQRGYRTGYSDGYMAGYRDSIDSLAKSATRHREYEAADRAYNKDYGQLEDYRDGYRQGFEIGYDTGFEKKTFESTIPTNLGKRGLGSVAVQKTVEPINKTPEQVQTKIEENIPIVEAAPVSASNDNQTNTTPTIDPTIASDSTSILRKASYQKDDPIILIPKDTELVLELQEDLNTESTRTGERFTAKVISHKELDGAIVEGHVEKVLIPGRIKRAAELQLTFDRIVLNDQRWSNFNGILTEVIPIKGDNVRRISDEGTAIGQSSIKGDVIKIGGATGAGAGVGALAGGPVGAAVGAGIGAALGIGAVVADRGKHIRLNKNQQLRIRTSYEARIR